MNEISIAVLGGFLIRFTINMVVLIILIRYIFYPKNGQKELIFTYLIMGMAIFLIGSLLDRVGIDMGFALGLFAVFSIIRFRTPPIEVKELSYLFLVVGISLVNSLVGKMSYDLTVALIISVIALVGTYFIESYTPKKIISKNQLTYVVSDLGIINDNKQLLEEIRDFTKIDIFKVEIKKINASKKELNLWIYSKEQKSS